MAGNEINGETDQMEQFNPEPPDTTAVAQHQQQAQSGGGNGMAEGARFRAADSAATSKVLQYLTSAAQGFRAYSATAKACAQDYLAGDQKSAAGFVNSLRDSQ